MYPDYGLTCTVVLKKMAECDACAKNISQMISVVDWIRNILVRIRMWIWILGSVPLSDGSGFGYGRPKFPDPMDLDPVVKGHKEVTKQ